MRTKRKGEITEEPQSPRKKEEPEFQVLICTTWKEDKGERCSDRSENRCLFIWERRNAEGVGLEESSFLIASSFSVKWEVRRAISESEERALKKHVKFCNCLSRK